MAGRQVRRFDIAELKAAERTPQGYLRAPAYATRTGVFAYRSPDGSVRRELRLPEEVFAPDSMATLASVPVTNDHPTDMLDAANTRQHMVGFTGEQVEPEDNFLKTSVTITDADAIKAVESGKQELSCGYSCEHEDAPGIYNGEPYDIIQRNIRYNHLAIVDRGRAGPDVKLRLDSDDAVQELVTPTSTSTEKGAQRMETIVINGTEYQVDPAVAQSFRDMQTALQGATDDAAAAAGGNAATGESGAAGGQTEDDGAVGGDQQGGDQTTQQKADTMQARIDSLAAKCANLEKQLKTRNDAADPKRIRELVKERARLETIARRTLSVDVVERLDSMSDRDIKLAVIKAEAPASDLTGKSEVYIQARFDHIAEDLAGSENHAVNVGRTVVAGRQDSNVSDAAAARLRSMEASRNAYKKPLSATKAKA